MASRAREAPSSVGVWSRASLLNSAISARQVKIYYMIKQASFCPKRRAIRQNSRSLDSGLLYEISRPLDQVRRGSGPPNLPGTLIRTAPRGRPVVFSERRLLQHPSTRHTRQPVLSAKSDGPLDRGEKCKSHTVPSHGGPERSKGAGSAGRNKGDNLRTGGGRGPQPKANPFLKCLALFNITTRVCADHFTGLTCRRSHCSRSYDERHPDLASGWLTYTGSRPDEVRKYRDANHLRITSNSGSRSRHIHHPDQRRFPT